MGLFSSAKDFLKKNLSVIQTGLDILGFVPIIGTAADLINAGIYAAQGDYKSAALSALSAVPGIGDAAGALKVSAKAAKIAKNATKAAKVAERSIYLNDMREDLKNGDFVSLGMRILGPAATKGIVKVGAKAVKNVGNKLAGKFAGSRIGNKFANFKKWCKCNRFWGSCFTGETLVCTENGYVPIKEVPVGSLVYSMNEETGEIGLKEVEKVSRSSTHIIYTVQINGDVEINTTAYHQFYLDGEGWVGVIHLKIADRLLTKDGIALVTNIKKTRHEEAVPVFNFSIKDWVSYFVSKVKVYVHNEKVPCNGGDASNNPVFEVSKEKYPNHVAMLENAQAKGNSLDDLNRGSGTRAAKKNRYEAQKNIRKTNGSPPAGYDYDEFPYASTKQGGAGAHIELVPSLENQAVGRDLGIFYRENNMKAGDKFNVKIID